jgi:aryl-alcohol dehydrogenase-like predicted oxidoreductase
VSTPTHAERHGQAGSISAVEADKLEIAPGTARSGVEGSVPELATESDLREALEKAFDYRGDVTLTRKDGSKVDGYIFDRVTGATLATSFVRVLLRDSTERLKIAYADIAQLAFTGRDTAAGKSWEAWVRKYWEKKAAGETEIAIQPESLDE